MTSAEGSRTVRPPRLHWLVVLVLDVLTRGLFELIWLLMVGHWVRKVRGSSQAWLWAVIATCILPAMFPVALLAMIACDIFSIPEKSAFGWVMAMAVLAFVGARIFALFTLRLELAEEPICVWSGYWKTILFGCTYLQYRLRKLGGVPPVARMDEGDGGPLVVDGSTEQAAG